jgi:galactokinase
VPIPRAVRFVVVHSGLPRQLASTAYAERRRECERDAALIGVATLRDATPDLVADLPRARHVVAENARVHAAAAALRAADTAALGRLFDASHASLRDDFEVSTPELDVLAESLVAVGAYGARLTGAGFGGCVVAAADAASAAGVAREGAAAYAARTGLEPTTWVPAAADGAGAL